MNLTIINSSRQLTASICVALYLISPGYTFADDSTPKDSTLKFDFAKPIFPKELEQYGIEGRADIFVNYTDSDQISGLIVVNSDHPLFEKTSLDYVINSKLHSPIKDGKKLSGGTLLPTHYKMDLDKSKKVKGLDRTPYAFSDKPDRNLPPEFQYDVPPIVILAIGAVYPYELLKKNITGRASVSVAINPKGEVAQVKIIESTKPEFGEATKAMMESWKFQPASKNGKNIWSSFVKEQTFGYGDNPMKDTPSEQSYIKTYEGKNEDIKEEKFLDSSLQALHKPQPVFPLSASTLTSDVIINVNFMIDKEGNVRIPHVDTQDNQQFVWASLTAIKRWRYRPPMHHGEPVNVSAQIPFKFKTN